MLFKIIVVLTSIWHTILGFTPSTSMLFPKLDIHFPFIEKDSIATLEIPAISLKQDLYDKNDERSNLDEKLIFLKSSSTPEEESGNVIIAGHSGFGEVAYFKNLYKLKLGDTILFTYYNKNYSYQIVDMYKVPKTGQVEVIRDSNKKTITLITCFGNNEQLVVIGEQKK